MINNHRRILFASAICTALTLLGVLSAPAATYNLGRTSYLAQPYGDLNSVVLGAFPSNAAWTATANVTWLHFYVGPASNTVSTQSVSGSGSTNFLFAVDANSNVTRSGTFTIGGKTLTVTQAGSTYTQTPGLVSNIVSSNLNTPWGVAVDAQGNVYIADEFNNAVKEWTPTNNMVTTLVSNGLSHPDGVAVDSAGNVYIADNGNNAIKKWIAASSNVITLVSNGISHPYNVALDFSNNVYVADFGNSAVREWTVANSNLITLVSNNLDGPTSVAVDAAGNVYISDYFNNAVKEWVAVSNSVVTLFTPLSGGGPNGVAVDGGGTVYVADNGNNEIETWSPYGRLSATITSGLSTPQNVAVDSSGDLYIVDRGNEAIKERPFAYVDPTTKYEDPAAGTDVLPVTIPATASLFGPFVPTSDQSWLTVTGVTNGVVSFAFTGNPGPESRTASINVQGETIPVVQFEPGTTYYGDLLVRGGTRGADNTPPLVIMGEYGPQSPLGNTGDPLPDGTIGDIKFYGNNYDFSFYVLRLVGPGTFANEEQFQVVASNHFSGTASTGIQTILLSNQIAVTSGDYLAFCGTGPFYPQSANDSAYSDATYESSTNPGSFTATAPGGPGTTFTVGLNPDTNATYEYIPNTFNNQGRYYAFGVDLLPSNEFKTFSPSGGSAPQSLQPGTTVTITGQGFTSGSQVMFGNPEAWVNPSYVSADGTQIQAQVPRYATTGDLCVSIPGFGNVCSSTPFTVTCYRNTDGFSFVNDTVLQNYVGGWDLCGNATTLFGEAQTVAVDLPIPFDGSICLGNPFAAAVVFAANNIPALSQGQCFGFCLASQRLLHGDVSFSSFPLTSPGPGDIVFNIQGPNDNFSPQIADYIHIQHLAQISNEELQNYMNKVNRNVLATSADISNSVAADLMRGDHPIMAIHSGNYYRGDGHVLVAYDLEPDLTGVNYCYIDVYDPDIPFIPDEFGDVSGMTHMQNEQTSRITLKKNNTWSYYGALTSPNNPWGGSFSGLVETDYGTIPVVPGLPTSIYVIAAWISGGAAVPSQVTDTSGNTMFNADGSLNTYPSTSLLSKAVPFSPGSGSTNPEPPILVFGTNGTFKTSFSGLSNGLYSSTILGYNYFASVLNTFITTNNTDNIVMVTTVPGIAIHTDLSKPVTLQVVASVAGAYRNALLTTTSSAGGSDTLEFTGTGSTTVTYQHNGPATSFNLILTQQNDVSNTVVWSSPALNVGLNGSVTFTPSDWTSLPTTPVTTSYNLGALVTTNYSQGPVQVLPGGVTLTLPGFIGAVYNIEGSTNLTSWVILDTVTNATGVIQYTDTTMPEYTTRYYRALPE